MNQTNKCLNCDNRISDNFCSHCGQKTDTHRIIVKHFLFHDILHGVWHFDKGILYTIKEAIVRPGKAALDYINGKRIKYYNVFYLSLLLIGLNILLIHFYDEFKIEGNTTLSVDDTPNVTKFFAENIKFILFSIVPLLACNAYFIFKRAKLNIAEHFIIAGMSLLGLLLLGLLFNFTNFISNHSSFRIFGIFEIILFFMLILYPIWPYYNAFKKNYTILGTIWRLVLFQTLLLFEIMILIALIIVYITNGNGNFYINM